MTSSISENIEAVARDPLSLALAGVGISLAPHEYIGGIVMSLAGASIASAMNRDEDRRSFWLVMLMAIFVSHLAAISAAYFFPTLKAQFVMAVAGFGSRYIVRIALRVFGLLEDRSDRIADKIVDRVLPGDDK